MKTKLLLCKAIFVAGAFSLGTNIYVCLFGVETTENVFFLAWGMVCVGWSLEKIEALKKARFEPPALLPFDLVGRPTPEGWRDRSIMDLVLESVDHLRIDLRALGIRQHFSTFELVMEMLNDPKAPEELKAAINEWLDGHRDGTNI